MDKRQDFAEDRPEQETLAEFADLFSGLTEMSPFAYSWHPDREILRAYVAHRLLEAPAADRGSLAVRDARAFGEFLRGKPARWTHSDVALHVLTCRECQQQVAQLRESRLHLFSWARSQKAAGQPWWRRPLTVGAATALAAIMLFLWVGSDRPCSQLENQAEIAACLKKVDPHAGGGASVMVVVRAPSRF